MQRASLFVHVTAVLLLSQRKAVAEKENCAVFEFSGLKDNIISISENLHINLTFWLDVSGCEQLNTTYKVEAKTLTIANTTEDDGRVNLAKNTCSVSTGIHVACSSREGSAVLFRQVNRSHTAVEWNLFWKEEGRFKNVVKRLQLNFSHIKEIAIRRVLLLFAIV